MTVDHPLGAEPPAPLCGKVQAVPVERETPENDVKKLGKQVAWLLATASDRFELRALVEKRSGERPSQVLRHLEDPLLILNAKQVEVDPVVTRFFPQQAHGHHVVDGEELTGDGGLDFRTAMRAFGNGQHQALGFW